MRFILFKTSECILRNEWQHNSLFSGFCVAIIGTCRVVITSPRYAALWAFLGSVFTFVAMGMFHAIYEMETDTIKLEQFKAGWSTMEEHRYASLVRAFIARGLWRANSCIQLHSVAFRIHMLPHSLYLHTTDTCTVFSFLLQIFRGEHKHRFWLFIHDGLGCWWRQFVCRNILLVRRLLSLRRSVEKSTGHDSLSRSR